MGNEEAKTTARKSLKGLHPTVGLLTCGPEDPNSQRVWSGVADVARERDVNLICLPGKRLRSPVGFDAQANIVYDLVGPDSVDGLVIWGGGLGFDVSAEEARAFYESYRPLPVVSIALPLQGVPTVSVDNYGGMRSAVAHLLEVHHRERIAFIRGPEGHPEAEARYRAYADALAEYGLPIDPLLVVTGDFTRTSGVDGVRTLLDAHQVDLDAVVGCNDEAALGAMQGLRARGLRVPDDIAVVGFDDVEEAKYAEPPLTTVLLPVYDQGRRAMETLLRLLRGEREPEQVLPPTNLVVRQSCGCLDPLILRAAAESPATSGETLESALSERRAAIVSEMAQALGTDETVQDLEWSSKLIDAFANEPTSGSQGAFLTILNELLRWLAEAGRDVAACQGLLSVLRRQAMPSLLTDERALRRADDLWHQARVLIGGAAERSRVVRALRNQQRIETLRDVGQSLITAVDVLELTDVIARELPRLGIPSGYLSLYENRKAPTERSRLVLAYDRDGRLELEDGGRRFPSRSLAPVGVLSRADRFDMVLEPLYFRENQLGFALLEAGPDQTATCESLRTHVSTALQTILLHEQQRQAGKLAHRRAAQAALINEVGRRASSELDLQSLLSEVVTATQEAFGYYGVMLLLRDETTDCLVLESVAGGYVGVTPKGLRVAIGEGMTGHAAATGQTQISGDVSQNPHYVRKAGEVTQSELSVPIKSGDKVIGVLDLQSDALDAFDETDVVGMETLADQIAVAINNAHLYEAAHQELAVRMRVEAELAQRSAQIQALVLPMIETIERVTTKSQERMEAMNRLSGITQESYERMEATNAIIEKVAASANEMMAMIDVIDGIAANVNLLALNATIEAAHAGEYGKGFAVIAAEIRKLSSRTKSNAKDVSRTLRSAIEGIQDSARASEESFRAFREVEANVKEMLSTLQDISNRMADLSESSADILDLMDISSDNNPPTDQETDSGS